MGMRRGSMVGFVAAIGAATAPAALARPPAPARAPVVEAVARCRAVQADAARLACYDTAVAAMVAAEAKGDLVSIDRAQRRAVRRQAFGFSLPSLAIFDRGEKPDEVNRVTEVVASARRGPEGRWVLRMQDGAVWRQTDDADLGRRPHAGSKALIKRAALGSFMMEIDGQAGIRAQRQN